MKKRKLSSLYTPSRNENSGLSDFGKYLDIILEAAISAKAIKFQYIRLDSNFEPYLAKNGSFYELHVYALYYADNTYYIIGGHEKYRPELTKYRIDRMKNVEISKTDLIPAKQFFENDNPEYVLDNYIRSEVDHFAGDPIKIKLECDQADEIGRGILYDFLTVDEWKSEHKNGKLYVSFKKAFSPTLIGWILQNHDHFKILEPESLINEILRIINEIESCYNFR